MASKIEIINLALAHLGSGKEIASIDERSQEAEAARRVYDTALDETLRGYSWPFATKIRALDLIQQDPNSKWEFEYGYPTDCLWFRGIVPPTGEEDDPPPHQIGHGESASVIWTDEQDAEAEYTVRVTDTNRYPPDFRLAFSFQLAALMAPRLARDLPAIGESALKKYLYQLDLAKTSAGNEERPKDPPDPESIQART